MFFVAGSAHEAERCLFAGFDGGLVVGIDAEHEAGVGGGDLPEVEELADVVGVDLWHVECEVGALALDEGVLGGALLGVEERGEALAFEVLEGVDAHACGDGEVAVEGVDLDEAEDLVVWALAVELDLGVLVGGAECFDGCVAGVDDVALGVDAFAEALGPELAEPVCEEVEAVGVGHEHVCVLALACGEFDEECGEHGGGVCCQVGRGAGGVDLGGAVEECFDVDAAHGGGEEADGREDAESAADALGDGECRVALVVADGAHGALGGVGAGDDVVGVLCAEFGLEHVADDHELCGGLGGFAGLADDVEEALVEADALAVVEDWADEGGVDVVEDEELWAATLVAWDEIPRAGVECGLECDVAECGAADAEDDEDLAAGLALFEEFVDGGGVLFAEVAEGEVAPAFPAGASGGGE